MVIHLLQFPPKRGHSGGTVWTYCGWSSNYDLIFATRMKDVTCKICLKKKDDD